MATTDDLDCENLNSTECVLKYLKTIAQLQKSQQDEFNWDPISVYVTAAIGVLALWLALLTVGQAIFSAAHGRVKASRYAIGPWHKLSVSHLSWSEMRLGAVTYTPLISIAEFMKFYDEDKRTSKKDRFSRAETWERDKIQIYGGRKRWLKLCKLWSKTCLRFCVEWYFKPIKYSIDWAKYSVEWMRYFARYVMWVKRVTVEGMTRVDGPEPPNRVRVQQGQKALGEYFPAQWLCLLSFLSVDHPRYWPLRPVGLDYIPADLAAAPATGPVRDLCILALHAAARAETPATVVIDKDMKLPRIYTEWFDFHFERHPQLGYLAVFHVLRNNFLVEIVSRYRLRLRARGRSCEHLRQAYGAMELATGPDRFIDCIDEAALSNRVAHEPWAVRRQRQMTHELWNVCNDCQQLSGAHNLARVPGCSISSSQLVTTIWSPMQPFEILFSKTRVADNLSLFPYIRCRIWSQMRSLLLLKPKWLVESPPMKISLKPEYSWVDRPPTWYPKVRTRLKGLDRLFAKYPEDISQVDYIPPRDELKYEILAGLWPGDVLSYIKAIDDWLEGHEPITARCRKATLSILAAAASNLLRCKRSMQNDETIGQEHGTKGDISPNNFTIGSLQQDITHCQSVITSLAKGYSPESSPGLRRAYRSALLARLQNNDNSGVSQISSEKHDRFIDAFLELTRLWNEESSVDYHYIEHPIDDMIITRGILAGLYYLTAKNDTSWVLDGDETWNRVVSFL